MAPPTPEQSRRYERKPKGHVMRTYRNMLSRVRGVQKREAKFYAGLPILDKHDFYRWSLAPDSEFWPLYHAWKAMNYDRRLSPSIDRIDVYGGYVLNNMQWVTHSENSGRITRRATGPRMSEKDSAHA